MSAFADFVSILFNLDQFKRVKAAFFIHLSSSLYFPVVGTGQEEKTIYFRITSKQNRILKLYDLAFRDVRKKQQIRRNVRSDSFKTSFYNSVISVDIPLSLRNNIAGYYIGCYELIYPEQQSS